MTNNNIGEKMLENQKKTLKEFREKKVKFLKFLKIVTPVVLAICLICALFIPFAQNTSFSDLKDLSDYSRNKYGVSKLETARTINIVVTVIAIAAYAYCYFKKPIEKIELIINGVACGVLFIFSLITLTSHMDVSVMMLNGYDSTYFWWFIPFVACLVNVVVLSMVVTYDRSAAFLEKNIKSIES